MDLVKCPLALHYHFIVGDNRTLTVQQWEDFCLFNQTRADTEIANSVRIREAIHQTMQQTANDLLAQHTATAFALRKRCHEQEMALDELQWQKKQVYLVIYIIMSVHQFIHSTVSPSHCHSSSHTLKHYHPLYIILNEVKYRLLIIFPLIKQMLQQQISKCTGSQHIFCCRRRKR